MVVGSPVAMSRGVHILPTFDAFVDSLRATPRTIPGQRAARRPGEFKLSRNRTADSHFVAPEQLRGTLTLEFDLVRALPHALQRAIALMFVIGEVHPFDDGNGRVPVRS